MINKNNDFLALVTELETSLPVCYKFVVSQKVIEIETVLRVDEFSFYNSKMSACKDFYRPISKIHDKSGKI